MGPHVLETGRGASRSGDWGGGLTGWRLEREPHDLETGYGASLSGDWGGALT